jgi:hypothetical protein
VIIEYKYQQVVVPQEIVKYCDYFTFDANRDDLRYLDCIYMHMGYYGNDLHDLRQYRQKSLPLFE